MALKQEHFALTDDELGKINAVIREATDAYDAHDPDADPPDQVTVWFEFAARRGRFVSVSIAGKHFDIA